MAAEGVSPGPAAFIFVCITLALDMLAGAMLLAAFRLAAFLTRQRLS